jgi:hypothetical protein
LTTNGIIIFNNAMCFNQRYGADKINGSKELIKFFKDRYNVKFYYESEFIDRRNLCLIVIMK